MPRFLPIRRISTHMKLCTRLRPVSSATVGLFSSNHFGAPPSSRTLLASVPMMSGVPPTKMFSSTMSPSSDASAKRATDLTSMAIQREEGRLTNTGVLVVETGRRTGRSPKDRFLVRDALTEKGVEWNDTNQSFSPKDFDYWNQKAQDHLESSKDHLTDTFLVGNTELGVSVKVTTEYAWHMLFAHNLFTQITPTEHANAKANSSWELINLPNLKPEAGVHGANSNGMVVINFTQQRVLILGMRYGGEMKKSMFTVLNYLLPDKDVFPMHCSANIGKDGESALFFGLSGTGKTTLSMDASRKLIGDDEHGWSTDEIFNFEGGCYAKVINLDPKAEPVVYEALRPGALMENVVMDDKGVVDFYDGSLTENTRAAYPRSFIDNCVTSNAGPAPKHVIFLTCDMFGVLPPVSKLTAEQALFYFLSGYTAKVGSTEVGGGSGVSPTFSTCFGAPFFPRAPMVYAQLLLKRVQEVNANVYLVNTGWHQGEYGQGGNRYSIATTREVIKQITDDQLSKCTWESVPGFELAIPKNAALPCAVDPRSDWVQTAGGENAYTQTSNRLIEQLNRNFDQYDPDHTQTGRPSPVS